MSAQTIDDHSILTSISTLADVETSGASLPLYRSLGFPRDFSINEFLARKFQIYSYSGSGTITLPVLESYAYDFFVYESIAQKLKYSRLVRGTFCLEFVLTTAPYAAGQFIAAVWMGSYVSNNAPSLDVTLMARNFASKTHVVLDCATTNLGVIKIPMHLRYPYGIVSIDGDPVISVMQMAVTSLTPIVNTMDGTDAPYNIKVYISLVNTEVTIPVVRDIGSIYTSEIQQTADGPISYPASILAMVGRKLRQVPVVGKFAYATSLAAGAIADIAILFGMSRPTDLSSVPYAHDEAYAGYVGAIRQKTLTLDPLQEIPLDASFLGEQGDNLTFANTICRPGVITMPTWSYDEVNATTLFQFPVTPTYGDGVVNNVYAVTPMAYGAQLFQAWRGSIYYTICIPANKFVRGKLRVFWSPTRLSDTIVDYQAITQNAPSVLIDLASAAQATLIIPWGSQIPYLPNFIISTDWDDSAYVPDNTVNGFIYGIVEEQLIAQAAALELTIVIWAHAGDDFELHIPTTHRLNYLKRQLFDTLFDSALNVVAAPVEAAIAVPTVVVSPPALLGDSDYYEYTMLSSAVEPVLSSTDTLLPVTAGSDAAVLHMGEKFMSFRNLLQRFYPHFYSATNTASAAAMAPEVTIQLPYLPSEQFVYMVAATPTVQPILTTPTRFISNLFYGVRGPIRYRINFPTGSGSRPMVRRNFDIPYLRRYANALVINWFALKSQSGTGECAFDITNGESAIVEIPWQCYSQYLPTTIREPTSTSKAYGVSLVFSSSFARFDAYQAIGEGFNPVIWNGVPLLSVFAPGDVPA